METPTDIPEAESPAVLDAWERYEKEKARLRAQDLTPAEYDRAIDELLNELGL